MVRPERFELPASWFVARRSIQLSYGRKDDQTPRCGSPNIAWPICLAALWGRQGREYYHINRRSPFHCKTLRWPEHGLKTTFNIQLNQYVIQPRVVPHGSSRIDIPATAIAGRSPRSAGTRSSTCRRNRTQASHRARGGTAPPPASE